MSDFGFEVFTKILADGCSGVVRQGYFERLRSLIERIKNNDKSLPADVDIGGALDFVSKIMALIALLNSLGVEDEQLAKELKKKLQEIIEKAIKGRASFYDKISDRYKKMAKGAKENDGKDNIAIKDIKHGAISIAVRNRLRVLLHNVVRSVERYLEVVRQGKVVRGNVIRGTTLLAANTRNSLNLRKTSFGVENLKFEVRRNVVRLAFFAIAAGMLKLKGMENRLTLKSEVSNASK